MNLLIQSIQIRKATPADIEGVLTLVKDFVASFELIESKFRQSYANILKDANAIAFVVDDDRALVGYCLGFCHDTFYANGKVAWLEEISVSSSYRRQRIGESLLGEIQRCCAICARNPSCCGVLSGY
jgi:N-acetylglutamate synthase-like GNAT family acetyltransferase